MQKKKKMKKVKKKYKSPINFHPLVGYEASKLEGMHWELLQDFACNLRISLAFSLALFPLSTSRTKQSLATTPILNIS
jgi:hypothetical protein